MGRRTNTLIAVGLVAVVAIALFLLGGDPPPEPRPDDRAPVTTIADTADTAVPGAGEKPPPEREAVVPAAAIPDWLDHPYELRLELLVVDRLGLPVGGRTLKVGPADCSLNKTTSGTGPDGRIEIVVPSRQRHGEVLLVDDHGKLRRIALSHGAPTRLTLTSKDAVPVHQITWSANGTITLRINGLGSGRYLVAGSGGSPTMGVGLHPHARFVTAPGPGGLPKGASIWLANASSGIELQEVHFGRLVEGLVISTPDQEQPDKPVETRITGTVFGADGRVAEKLPVALIDAEGDVIARTATDEEGVFAFEGLRSAEYIVQGGGDAAGLARTPAVTTTGTTPVTLHLQRGVTIRGRAETAGGLPIDKARVAWQASDGSWSDSTETDEHGEFTLANLPGAPGTVMLWHGNGAFPLAVQKDVLANTTDLLLRDDRGRGALTLDPAHPDGLPGAAAIRVWCEQTGLGAVMPEPDEGQPWGLRGLPSGWYRVELFHAAVGTLDAGRHWVGDGETCDLGRVVLGESARVEFSMTGESGAAVPELELYRLRDDLDVRVQAPGLTAPAVLQIPAGDYVVFWTDGSDIRRLRFDAVAGEQSSVRVQN